MVGLCNRADHYFLYLFCISQKNRQTGWKTLPPKSCEVDNNCDKNCSRLVFWATVCKTVRPMLSDRCLSLSVLSVCPSVTLVYCGQMVGWIKMKLGMQVGLGPGHIVLDGDLAPLCQRGTAPNFRPMSVVAKMLDGLRCHLVWR